MSEATRIVATGRSGDAMVIALDGMRKCPQCRSMHAIFINRDGRTLCVGCDRCITAPQT